MTDRPDEVAVLPLPVTIRFRACRHLDFRDIYTCKKQIITGPQSDAVFWLRENVPSDLPTMVQFCQLRGRLNNPMSCLTEHWKQCSKYDEVEHTVIVPNP